MGGERRYMTAREAAAYLRLSISTIHKLSAGGGIPVYRVGAKLLFATDELDGWLEKGRRRTADELSAEATDRLAG